MPELYHGPTTDFLEKSHQNRIAEELRGAFFEHYGYEPPDSEQRAWRNSLRAQEGAIRLGGFTGHGLLLEYQLPLSSRRLDAMLTGKGPDGDPSAVIVELKQWDHVEPSDVPECVGVRYGGRMRDVLHPSAQVGQYRQYLVDAHTSFHPGGVRLDACSYLHDFLFDEGSELLSDRHANLLGVYPLFAGDRVDDLVQYLDDRIGGGRGQQILRTVREGRYRPHKKLLKHTARMIRNEPAYVLLDEQRVVFNSIVAHAAQAREMDHKAVFVVRGGPGTGKSVLALNLVAELSEAGYLTITPELRVEASGRMREDFDDGESYLTLHGRTVHVPREERWRPDPELLRWHNENRFRG